jgi:hypothetical protein
MEGIAGQGDPVVLRAWNVAVAPDDVRGLLHLRAIRFAELALAEQEPAAIEIVTSDAELAHALLVEALRPRLDGGRLFELVTQRIDARDDPASLVLGLDRAVRDLRRWASRTLRESATVMRYGPLNASASDGMLCGIVTLDDDGSIDIAQVSTADLRRQRSWLRAEFADVRSRGLTRPALVITEHGEADGPYLETWPNLRCVPNPAAPR